jgi:DNA-directed RNA polymerase specialized sigma24 family protein
VRKAGFFRQLHPACYFATVFLQQTNLSHMNGDDHPPKHAAASFLTIRWSMVRQAAAKDEPGSQRALAELCKSYWYPIYAYIRRTGQSPHDAEDLTQGFFARLLQKNFLAVADKEKGRPRAFLLTCVKCHLADEHDRAMTQKRGAGKVTTFTSTWAEERYAAEPVENLTPDRLYQRRWALTLLDATLETLEKEFALDGNAELFTALRPYLGFSASVEENYQATADRLGMNLNTLKSHIHRLRERWKDAIMAQVASTLDDPTSDNIKAELSELVGCV